MKTRYDYTVEKITNKDYFFMVENQVRKAMMAYEEGICLGRAENVLSECDISWGELVEYPIEGYYYKTNALKKYFTIIRNLQHNESIFHKVKDSDDLAFLQSLTSSEIWGELKKNTTNSQTVMSDNEFAPTFRAPYTEKNPPLVRRYDILTLTMEDERLFNLKLEHPWTMDSVVKNLSNHYKGRANLVELAYLTKEIECLLCGVETNSLYRMLTSVSGYYPVEKTYKWEVSPEVESLGKELIKKYNELIGSNLVAPTIFNHKSLTKDSEKPRVATLGKIYSTGEYYFWIMEPNGKIYDKYSTEFITTEQLIENK